MNDYSKKHENPMARVLFRQFVAVGIVAIMTLLHTTAVSGETCINGDCTQYVSFFGPGLFSCTRYCGCGVKLNVPLFIDGPTAAPVEWTCEKQEDGTYLLEGPGSHVRCQKGFECSPVSGNGGGGSNDSGVGVAASADGNNDGDSGSPMIGAASVFVATVMASASLMFWN